MLYICASVLAPLQVSTFLSPQTPAQIFWHIAVQKKWHKLSKLGGGGRSNMDKSWTDSYMMTLGSWNGQVY